MKNKERLEYERWRSAYDFIPYQFESLQRLMRWNGSIDEVRMTATSLAHAGRHALGLNNGFWLGHVKGEKEPVSYD